MRKELDRSGSLEETSANGRPAVALYHNGEAHAVMALGFDGDAIGALTRFGDPRLFSYFGLPMSYGAPEGSISGTDTEEGS